MDTDKAIIAFSQSEKIKAGIIWASQLLNMSQGQPDGEKKVSENLINVLLNMIMQEARLAETVSPGMDIWNEIEQFLDKALVMVNSGVADEATIHLSKALSKVTSVGQQSMTVLKEKGLI